MQLQRITISVDHGRRVVLYPQGGWNLEAHVEGIGWVLDNDADVADELLADLLLQARNITADAAAKLCPFEVAGSCQER